MDEKETIERIVKAVRKVREKHLLIIDIANEATKEDGELDYDLLADRQRDVNLAVAEARAYSRATEQAVNSLKGLMARKTGDDYDPRIEAVARALAPLGFEPVDDEEELEP